MTIRPLTLICLLPALMFAQSGKLGVFTNSGDVGGPATKGAAEYSNGQYRITGAGANMWAKQDQFQYVWREVPGNFTATATVKFLGEGNEHRKAGIVVRQSLDTDSTYAHVAIHGNGMPGLQWRSRKGEDTNTFDLPFDGPGTFQIRMVRNGVRIYMYLAKDGAPLKEIMHTEVSLSEPGAGRSRSLLARPRQIRHRCVLGRVRRSSARRRLPPGSSSVLARRDQPSHPARYYRDMADHRRFTAIVEREDDGYVALCPEYDIASEGATIEDARENLMEALTLFFECADPAEAQRRNRPEILVTQVEIRVA